MFISSEVFDEKRQIFTIKQLTHFMPLISSYKISFLAKHLQVTTSDPLSILSVFFIKQYTQKEVFTTAGFPIEIRKIKTLTVKFRIGGAPSLLIIPFLATLPSLIQQSQLIFENFASLSFYFRLPVY